MKSRFDFGTDEQYKEYLRHYYVGQIICGANLVMTNNDVTFAIKLADELIKQLKINEK